MLSTVLTWDPGESDGGRSPAGEGTGLSICGYSTPWCGESTVLCGESAVLCGESTLTGDPGSPDEFDGTGEDGCSEVERSLETASDLAALREERGELEEIGEAVAGLLVSDVSP